MVLRKAQVENGILLLLLEGDPWVIQPKQEEKSKSESKLKGEQRKNNNIDIKQLKTHKIKFQLLQNVNLIKFDLGAGSTNLTRNLLLLCPTWQ